MYLSIQILLFHIFKVVFLCRFWWTPCMIGIYVLRFYIIMLNPCFSLDMSSSCLSFWWTSCRLEYFNVNILYVYCFLMVHVSYTGWLREIRSLQIDTYLFKNNIFWLDIKLGLKLFGFVLLLPLLTNQNWF